MITRGSLGRVGLKREDPKRLVLFYFFSLSFVAAACTEQRERLVRGSV
jgi:hypothetical protein